MDVTNATLPYLRKVKDGCVVVFGSRSAWRPEILVSRFTSSNKGPFDDFVGPITIANRASVRIHQTQKLINSSYIY